MMEDQLAGKEEPVIEEQLAGEEEQLEGEEEPVMEEQLEGEEEQLAAEKEPVMEYFTGSRGGAVGRRGNKSRRNWNRS